METELRSFFYERLGGFSDKRYKNINQNSPFSLSDYNHDVQEHATYVHLNVIDNSTLEILFSNNIEDNFPMTQSLDDFLEDYDGTCDRGRVSIVFKVSDYDLLKTLKREFGQHYPNSPNYAWVKKRIISALDKLIKLLNEFNNSLDVDCQQ